MSDDTIKRLLKENVYLEGKIKQLGDDINEKCKRHLLEIEKTRDFYQEQVNDLIEERDELERKLESIINESKTDYNKQEYEEELEKRDKIIILLEENIKSLGNESVQMINFIEQKYKNEIDDLKKTVTELENKLKR
jgi:hypothetical protein